MKVTYNWLKDFVEIRIPPFVLARKLTLAGLEVISLEERDGDFVFELEITANRSDCLSVVGIAREVAAITKAKFRAPSMIANRKKVSTECCLGETKKLPLIIQDKKDCPYYSAKIIRGVKVAPSPPWLKERLELVGCRSINNIVDITNYILLTWGEPLHAFDLDKLSSEMIVVRRAKPKEKIMTIDGKEKLLDDEILVIADKERPIALAGIMGGLNTEVTSHTQNILLEAAIF
ncbi:MAG: phenylalanine--tRNA ligase beta subunit-related protein, partial [Candidatus Omnitrophica bacterium]|nr:phenylalanine--tRNA ligase beta subunit-related protein [Candidatus Omnitrophota bacterium]